jgi:hypothetical protein
MLGNLLDELVKLLPVYTQQNPTRVRRVAVQRSLGLVAEVLVVLTPGVVGIDVLWIWWMVDELR